MAGDLDDYPGLRDALVELYGDGGDADRWLHAPNPFLGDRSPMQCIRSGDGDEVLRVLDAILSGAFM